MRLPLLVLHICGGVSALLAGFSALAFRKGSRWHSIAGDVFAVAMVCMGTAGVSLAIMKSEPGNILGGTLTLYLVTTSWMTAKRRKVETSIFDWSAFLTVLTLTAVEMTFGVDAALSPTGLKYDYPPGPYFLFGSVALLAATGDVRILLLKNISGTQRIARHLWRMCFALFIASTSLFLARQQLFPALLRKTGTLVLLSFLPLIVMIFWLVRMRLTSARKLELISHAHA